MSIVKSVLMCHAPIVIPPVGGSRGAPCHKSTEAMERAAEELAALAPDVLVCLSPHTPRLELAFGVLEHGPEGDFARFGAPSARVRLPDDEAARRALLDEAEPGLVEPIALGQERGGLDHGAAVPLWFLQQAGFAGPTLVVGLPWKAGHHKLRAFGQALARAAAVDGRRWALLASGDMSHRLKPGAPAGFHEDGARFDEAFVSLLEKPERDPRLLEAGLVELDELREHAAEDVVDTVEIAAAAHGYEIDPRVLSYEGPFGVGYCVAALT